MEKMDKYDWCFFLFIQYSSISYVLWIDVLLHLFIQSFTGIVIWKRNTRELWRPVNRK